MPSSLLLWTVSKGRKLKEKGTSFFLHLLISAPITRANSFNQLPFLRFDPQCIFHSALGSNANCGHKNGGGGGCDDDDDDKIGECKNICESVAKTPTWSFEE